MVKQGNDLKVNGHMSLNGGKYNNAVVNGALDIDGSLECSKLEINGLLDVDEDLKAGEVLVRGKLNVEGSMEAESVYSQGKVNVEGDLKSGDIRVEGSFECEGAVEADRVSVKGEMIAEKGLNAEEFSSIGKVRVEGLLNADKIKCELYGKSYAEEIGGMEIAVEEGRGNKWLKSIFPGFFWSHGKLIAGTIEGDRIELENTEAKIVRGTDVVIGEGCDIMLVEYKNSFKASSRSKITESRKI
jgi:cytoskeletal protein CcmA (bactofilin family)